MREVEVKILEINRNEIIKKLELLGAKKVFEGNVSALYYDFDNLILTKEDKTLRLRKKGEKAELTFKQKISKDKAKIMDEHEIQIENFETTKKILESIGLKEIKRLDKHRLSYSLGNVHFELDTLPGIPTFLEIESEDLETVKKSVEKLELSMKDAKPWSGKEVLEYYRKNEDK